MSTKEIQLFNIFYMKITLKYFKLKYYIKIQYNDWNDKINNYIYVY